MTNSYGIYTLLIHLELGSIHSPCGADTRKMKRKRGTATILAQAQAQASGPDQARTKRPKLTRPWSPSSPANDSPETQQPVLSIYYPRVVTLRAYILELLPTSSKSRRRKVASIAKDWNYDSGNNKDRDRKSKKKKKKNQKKNQKQNDAGAHRRQRISLGGGVAVNDARRIQELGRLLDSTLVGVLKPLDNAANHSRQQDLAAFTQSQFRCSTLACTDVGATSSQSEVSRVASSFCIYPLHALSSLV